MQKVEDIYNSVVLLDGTGRQVYRKRHLVPFGEFFPFLISYANGCG